MMNKGSLMRLFVVLGMLSIVDAKKSDPLPDRCHDPRNEFTKAIKLFYGCILENSERVFWVCTTCDELFTKMEDKQKNLTITHEPPTNTSCWDYFTNNNKLNYFLNIYEAALDYWNDANCKECFDWKDGELHQNLSGDTIRFYNLTEKFTNCTAKNKENTCEECNDDYTNLNAFYEDSKNRKNDKLCFDIRDTMNQTREKWSGELKCCHDKQPKYTNFIVLVTSLGCVVIAFYGGFFIHTKRKETNYFPVINDDSAENTAAIPSSSGLTVVDPGPSSSMHPIKNSTGTKPKELKNVNLIQNNLREPQLDEAAAVEPTSNDQNDVSILKF